MDCLAGLRALPDDCIDIAITSPPYWGQRGDAGIGLEQDPREYVNNLVTIFLELMRVVKAKGVFWLNIGDAYNTPINWRLDDRKYSTLGADKTGLNENNVAYTKDRGKRKAFIKKEVPWAKYGNLLGLPQRIVFALCDHGIYYRGEVIWAKRNPMPEGRCRRPHRGHEAIYILANSENHHFRVKPRVVSVWDLKPDPNPTAHTSTFPLDLPLHCINASGIDTGIVLDPFMGSGTTGLAAKLLGFDFIGFELDKANTNIANKRIKSEKHTIPIDFINNS